MKIFFVCFRGTTFRKAFGALGALICQLSLSRPTVLALSATLQNSVLQPTVKQLMLKSPRIITLPHSFTRFNFNFQLKNHQMERALYSILTPIADDLKQQKQDYPKTLIFSAHSTITPVTYFMAHRLGKDMYVDGVQRSSNKLVIQFHGQTDTGMQKEILNEFRKMNSRYCYCEKPVKPCLCDWFS